MRLRAFLHAACILGIVGTGAWAISRTATAWFERDADDRITGAISAASQNWARIDVDGLNVTISGEAPDETSRFRAVETARQIVDPDRIRDTTTVAASDPLSPPPFALELLRNETQISLIGLVPEDAGRDEIVRALATDSLGAEVTDMLETAAAPAPDDWAASLAYGLDIIGQLPRAKISVQPGAVTVTATAESDVARSMLEQLLEAKKPKGLNLTLDISAPRPVIAPFRVAFELVEGEGRLTACAAESPEDAETILSAARRAGLSGDASCPIGLGAPTEDWARAVKATMDTLHDLGGGRFAISDVEATLIGPADIDPGTLSAAGERLRAELPPVISLTTLVPPRMAETSDGSSVYAPEFSAELGTNGNVRLAGALQSETSRAAVASYAGALFGPDFVTSETVVDPALPEGWPGRVLTGIEALARLKEGSLNVTLDSVALNGWSIEADADSELETLFAQKVGSLARVDVSYDAEASAVAARTKPEICADEIGAIMKSEKIEFDAGSASIAPESRGVIAAMADVLRTCPGAYFEIGGHTDSQGRAEVNQRLSEDRAEAVMSALESEELPLILLSARGYGSDRPVADNATAAGRSSNRRIEVTLIQPEDIATTEADAAASVAASPPECAADLAAILEAAPIQFDLGSSEIAGESAETVAEMGEVLAACPGIDFEIGGHTDSRGRPEVNARLSQERADAVREALEAAGVQDVTLTARGYGSERPVADNDTAEGRERNRRIELALVGAEEDLRTNEAADELPMDGFEHEEVVDTNSDGREVAEAGTEVSDCAAGLVDILENGGIEFELGSSSIAPESAATVTALTEALGDCSGATLEIGGHTDDRGSSDGNLRLSRSRAEVVRAALETAGTPDVTLVSRGYGETNPIADNASREGRTANRRIEIKVLDDGPEPGAGEVDANEEVVSEENAGAAGSSDEP